MFRNLFVIDDADSSEVLELYAEQEWVMPPVLMEMLPVGLIEDQA